MEAYMMF